MTSLWSQVASFERRFEKKDGYSARKPEEFFTPNKNS